ncbi:hypothetical protein GF325_10620 [Candidatus Bathyarchaeota archaeon]|nr:hypothetical protein [Candidatus Bathyarchaeota archaeon]
MLSLDGAKPRNDRPAFRIFTDRQTGRILLSRFLEKANADVLVAIFEELEDLYGVPIIAVISAKQKRIVNAVKEFSPGIPHVFCQFHFLHHVREPVASKDSHLLTVLRSTVKSLSIVANRPQATSPRDANLPRVGRVFAPVTEKLLCTVGTRDDRLKVYPGLEAFANLEHLLGASRFQGPGHRSRDYLLACVIIGVICFGCILGYILSGYTVIASITADVFLTFLYAVLIIIPSKIKVGFAFLLLSLALISGIAGGISNVSRDF